MNEGDISEHTKSAQKITKEWQEFVCIVKTIESEVKVSPKNSEKIDVVDFSERVAFELKVSGNNTHHEFYKDLVKILTYNENNKSHPLRKLVFISESEGIKKLKRRLDKKLLKMLKNTHKLEIELIGI